MPPLVEAADLWASYGSVRAVRGVTLAVPEGSLVALLGPNGAGKSTLLKVLAGLLAPDRGRVTLGGRDVTGFPAHRMSRLGVALVPEGRGIFPSLPVKENLALLAGDGEAALKAFPVLRERVEQLSGTLSGGEQQMLALSRAAETGARVIMLDEPSLGLAPRLVDEIFARIEALRGEGRTVILVEQYVTRALPLADFVYVMQKGQIVFAGEPGELRHHPALERSYLGVGRRQRKQSRSRR